MIRRAAQKHSPSDLGLSLIELVVAMALFALVAVMGAQALTGMLRLRDGLSARSDRSGALAQATSVLRADLSAAVPILFYPAQSGLPLSALQETGDGFDLSIAGQPRLRPTSGGPTGTIMQRVQWRLRDGQLSRQVWYGLTPLDAKQQQPPQRLLQGVTDWQMRTYWQDVGWTDGATVPGLQPLAMPAANTDAGPGALQAYSSLLPDAIEITLEIEGIGPITLLEALK